MAQPQFLIIALDGGAATGKSSTSRGVAQQHNLLHVDTGTHYRALTLACLDAAVAPAPSPDLVTLLQELELGCQVREREASITLNGRAPALTELRSEEVNALVSRYAALPDVRDAVKAYQRSLADVARQKGFDGLIMDGRDIGTVIFPDADLKIFLFADERTRSERRAAEGQVDAIGDRDKADQQRKIAPLQAASDAHRVDTGDLSLEEVIAHVSRLITETRNAKEA
ncbi:MAG: cytidylate kinase [Puniceicoccaceae bacterium 5H]|nr:MAG: cytidylate kinase [Puniceicoccaceae bacterium 5H]